MCPGCLHCQGWASSGRCSLGLGHEGSQGLLPGQSNKQPLQSSTEGMEIHPRWCLKPAQPCAAAPTPASRLNPHPALDTALLQVNWELNSLS